MSNEKAAIKAGIESIVQVMREQEGLKESMKETIKALKEEHAVPPKVARAVAKMIFDGNKEEKDAEKSAIDNLYDQMTSGSSSDTEDDDTVYDDVI